MRMIWMLAGMLVEAEELLKHHTQDTCPWCRVYVLDPCEEGCPRRRLLERIAKS